MALDAKLRVQKAKAERFKGYDEKRKRLAEELEERERAFKKSRVDKQNEERARWQETEKIKDEGRKLREEKERAAQVLAAEKAKKADPENEEPSLGVC
jgi:DnaJ homolog subfamily C member 17